MRGVIGFAAGLAALVVGVSASAAHATQASVAVYPAGTSFTASGSAPRHAAASVSLAMPIGAVDDAVILSRGAQNVSASATSIDSPLSLHLLFAHYVSVNGRLVPTLSSRGTGASGRRRARTSRSGCRSTCRRAPRPAHTPAR